MNACVVEGYALPVGSRIYIAQTAPHYMENVSPDPFSFESTAIYLHAVSTAVPGMRRTGWARTGTLAPDGWICNWLSTC